MTFNEGFGKSSCNQLCFLGSMERTQGREVDIHASLSDVYRTGRWRLSNQRINRGHGYMGDLQQKNPSSHQNRKILKYPSKIISFKMLPVQFIMSLS